MGREIRRVPIGWEHPKDEWGNFHPLLDETYAHALAEWENDKREHPDCEAAKQYTYEEWAGEAPGPNYYRPDFGDQELGWCFYENVSEGTPLSPVFSEPEALHKWLVDDGYPPDAAARFMVNGSAPSFVIGPAGLIDGVTAS
jgi:hypothetical protein